MIAVQVDLLAGIPASSSCYRRWQSCVVMLDPDVSKFFQCGASV
jgi:hypothetical protein